MTTFRSAVRIWISTLGVVACHAAPMQTQPDMPPVGPTLFAPGVISGPPTFSPDGTTAYFTRKRAIVVSRHRGDGWTEPEVAPFSGRWGDSRFYRSRYQDGAYQAPEQLPFSDGVSSDWDVTVAPDQSFLIFASDRPPVIASHGDDLFIAFRNGDAWGPVTHLGPEVNNAETGSIKPRLGPDHHTLYFMSDRGAPPRPDATQPAFRIWRVDLTPTLRAHLASQG